MAYYGNEPADVALKVGSGVITATEIQDASISTADISNDAITPAQLDDDGTGFQIGSLGIGAAVTGSNKLHVEGPAHFTGNITGTIGTASQTNITSVGTIGTGVWNAGAVTSSGAGTFTSLDIGGSSDIAGNLTLSGSSTTRYLFLNSGGNGGVWQEGNYELRFGTNDTERMKIEGDGTVVMNGALQPAGNVTIATHGLLSIVGGNNLTISGTATDHAGLSFATNSILPATESATNTNTVDLGASSEKFKDFYYAGAMTGGSAEFGSSVTINGTIAKNNIIVQGNDTDTGGALSTFSANQFLTFRIHFTATTGGTYLSSYAVFDIAAVYPYHTNDHTAGSLFCAWGTNNSDYQEFEHVFTGVSNSETPTVSVSASSVSSGSASYIDIKILFTHGINGGAWLNRVGGYLIPSHVVMTSN